MQHKKPKVIYLNKYSVNGGSSRVRCFQFQKYIEQGFEVEYSPLFSEKYLSDKYAGKSVLFEAVKAYVGRFLSLFKIMKADLVWIEKEAFPYLPFFFEKIVFMLSKKTIIEYDDAIFHNYDSHRSSFVRALLGTKIDKVMQHGDCVIAGNGYLEQRAKAAGAKKVIVVPSIVAAEKYKIPPGHVTNNSIPVIGWIGTPVTQKFLNIIETVLDDIYVKSPFKLHLIGVAEDFWMDKPYRVRIAWSDATEVDSLLKIDLGIMPLKDDKFEQGKCGFKLIQYMACGKPVLGSPVGVNKNIVVDGHNGFLCSNLDQWSEKIQYLLNNKAIRETLGANGRIDFENKYSVEKWGPQLLKIAFDTIGRPS